MSGKKLVAANYVAEDVFYMWPWLWETSEYYWLHNVHLLLTMNLTQKHEHSRPFTLFQDTAIYISLLFSNKNINNRFNISQWISNYAVFSSEMQQWFDLDNKCVENRFRKHNGVNRIRCLYLSPISLISELKTITQPNSFYMMSYGCNLKQGI